MKLQHLVNFPGGSPSYMPRITMVMQFNKFSYFMSRSVSPTFTPCVHLSCLLIASLAISASHPSRLWWQSSLRRLGSVAEASLVEGGALGPAHQDVVDRRSEFRSRRRSGVEKDRRTACRSIPLHFWTGKRRSSGGSDRPSTTERTDQG